MSFPELEVKLYLYHWFVLQIERCCMKITTEIDVREFEGFEFVRVGRPVEGDFADLGVRDSLLFIDAAFSRYGHVVIYRKLPEIVLPQSVLDVLPDGWWVAKDNDQQIWAYDSKPTIQGSGWYSTLSCVDLSETRAGILLAEQLKDIPWKKSKIEIGKQRKKVKS